MQTRDCAPSMSPYARGQIFYNRMNVRASLSGPLLVNNLEILQRHQTNTNKQQENSFSLQSLGVWAERND